MAAVAAGPLAGGSGVDAWLMFPGSELNPACEAFICPIRAFPSAQPLTSSWAFSAGNRSGAPRPASISSSESWTRTGRTSWRFPLSEAASSSPATSSCPSAMPGRHPAGWRDVPAELDLPYLPPASTSSSCPPARQPGGPRRDARKNAKFIQATAGGGSLVKAVADGQRQAFGIFDPLFGDRLPALRASRGQPRHRGESLRAPAHGWQQQFLITYAIINKGVWNEFGPGPAGARQERRP
ncbi:MAG: hypothetical protein MZU97_07715 [Bacillus subtilis]|nr:hypothetical protein [Bacillus subtilis]